MNIQNPSIRVTQAELFMRSAELNSGCSAVSRKINSIISDMMEKQKEERAFNREIILDQEEYHELFISDEQIGSMLLRHGDSFDKVYSRAKSLLEECGLDCLYIPFHGGKETVVLRRQDLLRGKGGMILASGYFSER